MTSNFDGFPSGFFKFFKELKENNNREWFGDNKPRYLEEVVEPSIAFIEAVAPKLEKPRLTLLPIQGLMAAPCFASTVMSGSPKTKSPIRKTSVFDFAIILAKALRRLVFTLGCHLPKPIMVAGYGIHRRPS